MNVAVVCLVVAAALVSGGVLNAVAKRWRLPFNALLMACGFAVSELTVFFGYDSGLRWYHLHDWVFALLLPLLLVASVSALEPQTFLREWRLLVFVISPALVVGMVLAAAVIFFAIGHPQGFPFLIALASAALFSATDPGEVIEGARGEPDLVRINQALEGESAISDVLAVTLFASLLSSSLIVTASLDFDKFAGTVVSASVIGLLAGLGCGGASRLVGAMLGSAPPRTLIFIALLFIAFVSCQYLFNGSGALAVLVAALIGRSKEQRRSVSEQALIGAVGWCARVVVFMLAGATVTLFMFRDQWLAIIIAIVAVTLARGTTIYAGIWAMRWTVAAERLNQQQSIHLCLGGPRGTIVLALALSLPLEFEQWYTVQAMAYGVVIYSVFIVPLLAGMLQRRA